MRGVILATVALALAACTTNGQMPGSAGDLSSRNRGVETRDIAVQWQGIGDFRGQVAYEDASDGRIFMDLPGQGGSCGGRFVRDDNAPRWTWSMQCAGDLTASGTLAPEGRGGGAVGDGKDSLGRTIRFTMASR